MNDDPTQVDVLYAKCEAVDGTDTSTIQRIADAIAQKFAEKGFKIFIRSYIYDDMFTR